MPFQLPLFVPAASPYVQVTFPKTSETVFVGAPAPAPAWSADVPR